MRIALAGLLLAAVPAPGQDVRPAPARPGLSWSEADSLTRKLADIQTRASRPAPARPRKAESVQVTQSEVNSYLNLAYAPRMPKGVSDVDVQFGQQRIQARGLLDLEQFRGKVEIPTFSPLSFLSGQVPVELSGKFVNQDGFGSIEWETAYISGIRVPITMLEQIVLSSTRTSAHPEGVDIHAPFRLPYSVRSVRLEPGKAFLEF
jgi:hypothetical protein